MKKILFALAIAAAVVAPVLADDCAETKKSDKKDQGAVTNTVEKVEGKVTQ